MSQDIVLSVDYHDRQCVVRRLAVASAREEVRSVPTTPEDLQQLLEESGRLSPPSQ